MILKIPKILSHVEKAGKIKERGFLPEKCKQWRMSVNGHQISHCPPVSTTSIDI